MSTGYLLNGEEKKTLRWLRNGILAGATRGVTVDGRSRARKALALLDRLLGEPEKESWR